MTLLADVRTGLATRIATCGLKIAPSGEWPDAVVPPAAMVKLVGQHNETGFGTGGDQRNQVEIEIMLALSLKGGLVNAQRAIELFLSNTGASSLYAAIAADRRLNSTVNYCFIRGWRAYDTVEVNNQEFMGAIVDVEVDVP